MVVHEAQNFPGNPPDSSVKKNDIISHKVSGTFCKKKNLKRKDQKIANIGGNPGRHAEVTKKIELNMKSWLKEDR